jgi:flavorubredoxin
MASCFTTTMLHDDGGHRCIVFNDLVRGDDGVQANQFLIVHDGRTALIDPGGSLLYTPLQLALGRHVRPHEVDLVLCSHQDPDIIGSVDKWLLYTKATVVCSKLWGRFVPHLVPHYMENAGSERYLLVDDEGGRIALGSGELLALPAHFLHSVGNLSFYDPVSRILFSGDVCSGLVPSGAAYGFVEDFHRYRPCMEGFHRRYMAGNRAVRAWVDMVRELDPAMIVPQHGMPFRDAQMRAMLEWLSGLACGIDLIGPGHYRAKPVRFVVPAAA